MKQHITEKQFLGLSSKGMDKYRDTFLTGKVPIDKMMYVNIGQMIEFLDENTITTYSIYRRIVDWKIVYKDMDFGKIMGGELCDALWEAVKEILEK